MPPRMPKTLWMNSGGCQDASIEEVLRRVQMPDVVALDLEARAIGSARAEDVFDVLERVLEDAFVRAGEVGLLPVELELLEPVQHREQAEVHRAHVERCDLGLELQRRLQPLLDGHRRGAASREIQHDVATALDVGRELAEVLGILRRVAIGRIARVQMHDRGARLRRADRGIGDLLGRDRQVRRHRRRVDAAGHRAGDDDFASLCHGGNPPKLSARAYCQHIDARSTLAVLRVVQESVCNTVSARFQWRLPRWR